MKEIVLTVLLISFIIVMFMLIRNEIVFLNYMKIGNAILNYHVDCTFRRVDSEVDYADMRNYGVMLFRIWDFGYKHILPSEKWEIIKNYINKERQSKGGADEWD